jgi:hypothetical protein
MLMMLLAVLAQMLVNLGGFYVNTILQTQKLQCPRAGEDKCLQSRGKS